MEKNILITELQSKIIDTLNLPDTAPADLSPDTPLFEDTDGLGLDSVDALELVVMLEKDYGITIDDKGEPKNIFASINSMADFIIKNRKS